LVLPSYAIHIVPHQCAKIQGVIIYDSFLTKMQCQHKPDYQLLYCYEYFNVSRYCPVSDFTKRLHSYSHLWKKLLPRITFSFWPISLVCDVTKSLTPWLLLVLSHEGHSLLAKIARKETIAAKLAVRW